MAGTKRKLTRTRHIRQKRRRVSRRPRNTIGRMALKLFERKKQQAQNAEIGLSSVGGWYVMTDHMNLSQGDSYAGIEGHMIRASGVLFTGFFKNNATSTMVVRYGVAHLPSGNAASSAFSAGTGVLEDSSGNIDIFSASTVQKLTGRFNRDRYRPKTERRIVLGSNSATDGKDVHFFRLWIPLKGLRLQYDGSGTLPVRNIFAFYAMSALGNTDESLGELVEVTCTGTMYYVDP